MAKTTANRGISADRIKNASAFDRTRENNAEFKTASKAATLLRTIFKEVTSIAKDRITYARLLEVILTIVKTDPINERGERTVNAGDFKELKDFQFNERAGITSSLFVRCPMSFNRVSGEVVVNIPVFVPRNMVERARGMTHYRIVAAAAAVNFDTEAYDYAMQGTNELPYNSDPTQAATLTMALPAASTNIVIAMLGIEYYQQVNARSYPLKSGLRNAATILLVDKPV
ncbi:hypothetical protein A4H97_29930 [Niastella yeongjuensis]|uniref:Uncharacterized protein n=1 Tax=Niastella yeongjuensis TaxID=354355 RepID=A0A1V9EQ95_9BACT|nr:hypothetical protein [Niastella yeongjuensis]OQP48055.1 hypothetical protein A4H97_29930 [Niastella yeongjuensis]SEO25028.1 hypothetical protein SAMN05660816_02386 [Niastella yeongjuensis]